jgi:demethylspheroidene O-methyltransferase
MSAGIVRDSPVEPAGAGWSMRLKLIRNRLLMSEGFRRFAAAFPLTAPLARRKAGESFDLVAGFVYSQVLAACVRLRLLETLAAGPSSTGDLAAALRLRPEAMTRLLRAAAALRLVDIQADSTVILGERGAALACQPGILAMIEHHAILYDDLRDPVALLRGEGGPTGLSQFWTYAGQASPGQGGRDAAAYSALMTASLPLLVEEVFAAYPLGRHRHLLDVGGGEGGFAEAAARRWPGLAVTLFDLPEVAARARQRLSHVPAASAVTVTGGDFRRDSLPRGADIVSLVRIVHDHDDEVVRPLLREIHAALPPGGTVLIAEPMAGEPGAGAVGEAYFNIYLLAMGQGRARRPDELSALLRDAGFVDMRHRATRQPLLTGLLTARCPPCV